MVHKIVNGILLLYHHNLAANAANIFEHIQSFEQHSRFNVWTLNTYLGFPEVLRRLNFDVVILHYSLFGWRPFYLDEEFDAYLRSCEGSYKIAFFQDEYRFWPERSAVLNQYEVDCVYTCLEPAYFAETYERFTQVPRLVSYIPGYVSEATLRQAEQVSRPDDERPIDIGYRGRQSYYYMGLGAQEKHVIGERFRELASDRGLVLDIETAEHKRIYGEDWLSFLGDCRATLGAEAGVSIFDMDDVVMPRYEALLAAHPEMTFEEMSSAFLSEYEDQGVYYRTISPRVFEAAAVRTCQILFEGKYSGVVEPMEHYIPLRKDFSNFEEVLKLYGDAEVRRRLSENAYRDLIASGRYSYEQFIASFDEGLLAQGLEPTMSEASAREVTEWLHESENTRLLKVMESRQSEYDALFSRYLSLQDQHTEQQKQLQLLTSQHVDLQNRYIKQQKYIQDREKHISDQQKELQSLTTTHLDFQDQYMKQQRRVQDREKYISKQQEELQILTDKYIELQNSHMQYQKKFQSLTDECLELQGQYIRQQEELQERDNRIAEQIGKSQALAAKDIELQNQYMRQQKHLQEREEYISEQQQKLHQLTEEYVNLQGQYMAQQERLQNLIDAYR